MVNPIRSVASKLLSAYAQRNLDLATDPGSDSFSDLDLRTLIRRTSAKRL